MKKSATLWLLLLVLVVGCTPNSAATPTIDANLLATQVVQTFQAQLTASAPPATRTPTMTITVAPTSMETSSLPTLSMATATLTLASVKDRADWVANSPVDGAEIGINERFDIVWTVRNIGETTWTKRYKIRYYSGWAIGERGEYYFREEVPPGGMTNLIVDAMAPRFTGDYTTTWVLSNEDGINFYSVTLKVRVVSGPTSTPTDLPTWTPVPSSPPPG